MDNSDTRLISAIAGLSAAQRAFLRQHLEEGAAEPLAIVGLSCRFPGGCDDPSSFWHFLRRGGQAIGAPPPGRWPDRDAPWLRGGYLSIDPAGFDAEFFRIPAVEAAGIDPQHRLLLELAQEAFDDAGLTSELLRGSDTAVFVGLATADYAQMVRRGSAGDAFTNIGLSPGIAANRISYIYDLKGPSLVLDTACSSSLVGLHIAGLGLQRREFQYALVGGANLILIPDVGDGFHQMGALSPSGGSRPFDADADGFLRGEGGGCVVVTTLSHALAEGLRVWALIRGTAVNQDGATNGLTAPNPLAQEHLLKEAYHKSGISPAAIDYVEAHGTGTPLGDPIELNALAAVFARSSSRPCLVGSVKANFGHLEAAAGIAGLIKTVLCLQQGEIAPVPALGRLNPLIAWERLPAAVPTTAVPWPAGREPRRAGVSSFSFGGTNAHVVLEAAPLAGEPRPAGGPQLLTVSGRTESACREAAERMAIHLERDDSTFADIAFTSCACRTHYRFRACVVAESRAIAGEALRACARGTSHPALVTGHPGTQPEIIVSFAAPLTATAPLVPELNRDHQQLAAAWNHARTTAGTIGESVPAGLHLQVMLAETFQRWGVRIHRWTGRHGGEWLAQWAAGELSLTDACLRIARMHESNGHATTSAVEDRGRLQIDLGECLALATGTDVLSVRRWLLTVAARVHCQGESIRWQEFDREWPRRRVSLPAYPFQRRRHWAPGGTGAGQSTPLLVPRSDAQSPNRRVFDAQLSLERFSYLRDHRILGHVVCPGACFLEMVFEAAGSWRPGPAWTAELVEFRRPLILSDDERRAVEVVLTPDDGPTATIAIVSTDKAGRQIEHVRCRVTEAGSPVARPSAASLNNAVPAEEFYRRAEAVGAQFGPTFRGLSAISTSGDEAWARIESRVTVEEEAAYHIHPARLDACLQSLAGSAASGADALLVPMQIESISLFRSPRRTLDCHVRRTASGPGQSSADLGVWDDAGNQVLDVRGIRMRHVTNASFLDADDPPAAPLLYRTAWREQPLEQAASDGWLSAEPQRREVAAVREELRLAETMPDAAELGPLCRTLALRCLAELGWRGECDASLPVPQLANRLGVGTSYHRLLHRLLVLAGNGDHERNGHAGKSPNAICDSGWCESEFTRLRQAYPACDSQFELLARCGRALPGVLRGSIDPVAVLFSSEAYLLTESMYSTSPLSRFGNAVAAAAIAAQGPDVRVLEVGAGTGSTTAAVLEHTTPAAYLFTDVSPAFLARAQERFGRLSGFRTARFDLERDPQFQDIPAGAFDVVLAANVVHATSDLRASLKRLRPMLADGGTLILIELTEQQAWLDLVFGLTEDWWKFRDTGTRSASPLVDVATWRDVLLDTGFGEVETVDSGRGLSVIVAHAAPCSPPAGDPGEWLILNDRQNRGRQLAERLEAHGDRCRLANLRTGRSALGSRAESGIPSLAADSPQDFAAWLPSAAGIPCRGIVSLIGLDAVEGPELESCQATFHLAQALARDPAHAGARLWIVTRGGQTVGAGDAGQGMFQSTLWGLGRVLSQEVPTAWGGLIDLDPVGEFDPAALEAELRRRSDDHVAYRGGTRFVARLEPVAAEAARPLSVDRAGTCLITGGLGGLGQQVAQRLAARGAKRIVLLGRRPASAETQAVLESLADCGAECVYRSADVADFDELRTVFAEIACSGPPLRGVVHAAGIFDDDLLSNLDWSRFANVLSPKVAGAWNLHRLTAELKLDFFVLFSSVAAILGPRGSANYAAANSFLDRLAEHRHRQGLPAACVGWAPFLGAGMADVLASRAAVWQSHGLNPLTNDEFLPLFESTASGQTGTSLYVLPLDWGRFAHAARTGNLPPRFADQVAAASASQSVLRPDVRPVAPGASIPQTTAEWLTLLRAQSSQFLGVAAEEIDERRPFQDLGVDSLTAIEWRSRLERASGQSLPASLLFDHPTIAALAAYLAERTGPTQSATDSRDQLPARSSSSDVPIAVIGLGCRMPGGPDADAFWQSLATGRDLIRETPAERWNWRTYYDSDPDAPGKTNSRWGGYLDDVAGFDADFFGISPREAICMDPQQRLLLEVVWETLEDAGVRPESLAGSSTGVFVGIYRNDYVDQFDEVAAVDGYLATGGSPSVASGRVSYLLGLKGPSLSLDTACSSSLVSVHLACESLRRGECRQAFAGGVHLQLSPRPGLALAKLRMLSPDGRCKAFGDGADGFVPGEGCGVVLLKPLDLAMADGDRILGVIPGSAVNQDGRSSGLTAPHGPSQEEVIRAALQRAELSPADVQYVEAHGTGTALGDPIELNALNAALGVGRDSGRPLLIGAVKANIGHLEAAAGIAGLIKVLLALRNQELPPQLHCATPSRLIAWDTLPVRVVQERQPWPEGPDGRRIAGVSSFGFSGTNAHVLVTSLPPLTDDAATLPTSERPHVLTLSARTPEALRRLARLYQQRLDDASELAAIAWTANTGRGQHAWRAAIVAATPAVCASALDALAAGNAHPALVTGKAGSQPPSVVFHNSTDAWPAGSAAALAAAFPAFSSMLSAPYDAAPANVPRETFALAQAWRQAGLSPVAVKSSQFSSNGSVRADDSLTIEVAPCSVADWALAVARLYVAGVGIDWSACVPADDRRRTTLPAYPFQRVRYWRSAANPLADRSRGLRATRSAMLGSQLRTASRTETIFETVVADRLGAVVADHRLHGRVIVPAAGFFEMALAAAAEVYPGQPYRLKDVMLSQACTIEDGAARLLQVVVTQASAGTAQVQILSRDAAADDDEWRLHLTGVIEPADTNEERLDLDQVRGRCGEELSPSEFYARSARAGFEFGPQFRGLVRAWRGTDESLGSIQAGPEQREEQPRFRFHPGLLDACLQLLGAAATAGDETEAYIPLGVEAVELADECPERLWSHVRIVERAASGETFSVDVQASDKEGRVVANIRSLHMKRVSRSSLAGGRTNQLAYRRAWREAVIDPAATPATGNWEVRSLDRDGARQLAQRLCARGLNACSAEDAPEVRSNGSRLTALVYLIDAAAPRPDEWLLSLRSHTEQIRNFVRQHLGDSHPPALWIVTRGAFPAAGDPVQRALWGLGQTVAVEHPELWGGLVDLPAQDAGDSWNLLGDLLASGHRNQQLRIDGRAAWSARLEPAPEPDAQASGIDPEGWYLITGGFGELARPLAFDLADRGARHLILTGRRPDERAAVVRDLRARGVEVRVAAADVSRWDDVSRLKSMIAGTGRRLRGVFHLAGLLEDGAFAQQSWSSCERVLSPKVDGALHLGRAFAGERLEAFVLYSSAAGLLGSPGQSAYALANAFLDGYAGWLRAQGISAVAVQWGPWREGMAARPRSQSWTDRGLTPLEHEEALRALDSAVRGPDAEVAVMHVNWERLADQFVRPHPLLAGSATPRPPAETARLREELAPLSPLQREIRLLRWLEVETRRIMQMPAELPLDPEEPLQQRGLDSIMALELTQSVSKLIGENVPATMLFNYPTLRDVARVVATEYFDEPPAVEGADAGFDELLTQVEQMSEEELDRLLADAHGSGDARR